MKRISLISLAALLAGSISSAAYAQPKKIFQCSARDTLHTEVYALNQVSATRPSLGYVLLYFTADGTLAEQLKIKASEVSSAPTSDSEGNSGTAWTIRSPARQIDVLFKLQGFASAYRVQVADFPAMNGSGDSISCSVF